MTEKGARGLGIKYDFKQLALLCFVGLVPETINEDMPWTLGEYIRLNGICIVHIVTYSVTQIYF